MMEMTHNIQDDSQQLHESKKKRFTRRQWFVFTGISVINIFAGMVYSLQGPFFPEEGEKKGATAADDGLIFGIFELVEFIFCPIFGKYIRCMGGPKFLFITGNFVTALSSILFGFLPAVPAGTLFLSAAFVFRIVMALGQAAYLTAWYAILAHEFPDSIATTFSLLETVFGAGMAFGLSVGGFLYEAGGFILPFTVIGGFLFFAAVLSTILLPYIEHASAKPQGFLKLLRIPSMMISYYGVFAVSFSFGFTQALLEPHLRQFNLHPSFVGLLFVITGAVYALTSFIWGFAADRGVNPKILCGGGAVLTMAAFLLIGPAPFVPLKTQLWMVILALVLQGMGMGGEFVGTFVDSTLAAKTFTGPALCGILMDLIGFRNTSQIVLGVHFIAAVLSFGYYAYEKESIPSYDRLDGTISGRK